MLIASRDANFKRYVRRKLHELRQLFANMPEHEGPNDPEFVKCARENRALQSSWHFLIDFVASKMRYTRREISLAVWNLAYNALPHAHVKLNFALCMRDIACGIVSCYAKNDVSSHTQHVTCRAKRVYEDANLISTQPNDHLGIILGMFTKKEAAKLRCVCRRFRDFITTHVVARDPIAFIKLEEAVYAKTPFFRMSRIYSLSYRKCNSYCHFVDGHSLHQIAWDQLHELHVGSVLTRSSMGRPRRISMPRLRKLMCSESALRWIVASNLTELVLKGRGVRDKQDTAHYVLAFTSLTRVHFEPGISAELIIALITRGVSIV